jgi:hypothetical protein
MDQRRPSHGARLYSDLVGKYGTPHTLAGRGLGPLRVRPFFFCFFFFAVSLFAVSFSLFPFLLFFRISKFLETEQILNSNKFPNWNKIQSRNIF